MTPAEKRDTVARFFDAAATAIADGHPIVYQVDLDLGTVEEQRVTNEVTLPAVAAIVILLEYAADRLEVDVDEVLFDVRMRLSDAYPDE